MKRNLLAALRPAIPALLSVSVLALSCETGCDRPQDGKEDPQPTASNSTERSSSADDGDSTSEGSTDCSPPDGSSITAVDIVEDHTFEYPVYLAQPPGDSETLYVVERPGRILRIRDGEILEDPFLDIRDRVGTDHQERGLLGLAFHPDYPDNGRFFVYYTPNDAHRNVVAEYRRREDESLASDDEVRRLVEVDDPEDNHNGGMITFGPDGRLYVGIGDGGGAGDRHGDIGNGQNNETLLGSILRLDVDAPDRDFAAEDNPFMGEQSGDSRIWAWGLRNPWRFSFDPETGDLYIGDVGQNKIEEIDVEPAERNGGRNYGWRAYEGSSVYDDSLTNNVEDHAEPAVDIPHGSSDEALRNACSVTGGYVYRGDALPGLDGAYLFGDYCSNDVVAIRYCDGEVSGPVRIPGLRDAGGGLASFGRDRSGDLYLVYHRSGHVKRIVSDDT